MIQDLHDRGIRTTVTLMWANFGRSPKINGRRRRPRPLVAGDAALVAAAA